jgi:hypothetical protein
MEGEPVPAFGNSPNIRGAFAGALEKEVPPVWGPGLTEFASPRPPARQDRTAWRLAGEWHVSRVQGQDGWWCSTGGLATFR